MNPSVRAAALEATAPLVFPFPEPPAPGTAREVGPGVFWLRMPLPFALDHINLWLLRDGDGWTAVDCGIAVDETRSHWESVFRDVVGDAGLTRVLVGDALVHENPRLQARINQLLDRIEATLKQCLKVASAQGALAAEHDFGAHADLLVCYAVGRWQRFVKSGFKADPLTNWPAQWPILAR
mgnify:CR=1 FL=1